MSDLYLCVEEKKFKGYLDELINICMNGRTYLKIHYKLIQFYTVNKKKLNTCYSIFMYMEDSLLRSAVMNLILLFEDRRDVTSIPFLLDYIEQNRKKIFWRNNKNVIKNIREDQDKLESKKNILGNLKVWRDKRLFHLDKKYSGDLNSIFRNYQINFSDIYDMFSLGKEILNRYSTQYNGIEHEMEYGDGTVINVEFDRLQGVINK
jgi:hypothetical protein